LCCAVFATMSSRAMSVRTAQVFASRVLSQLQRRQLPPSQIRFAATLSELSSVLKRAELQSQQQAHFQGEWRHFQRRETQAGIALKTEIMNDNPRMQHASLEEAVTFLSKHSGADHPEVAAKKVDLASMCKELGEYPKAERLLREALLVLEKEFGQHHPKSTTAKKILAGVCCKIGDYHLAKMLFEQVLDVEQHYLPPDNLMIAATKNNLGNACAELGDWASGKRLASEALEITCLRLPSDHPAVTVARRNLERYQSMEFFSSALPLAIDLRH